MKTVQFVNRLEGDVKTLILCHPEMQNELDLQLGGILAFNLARFSFPVHVTTNQVGQIPKLIIVENREAIASVITEKTVAIAIAENEILELAFSLLLQKTVATTFIFITPNFKEMDEKFHFYRELFQGICFSKEIIASPANQMPPAEVARRCQQLEKQGICVEILDEKKLQKLGAEALLAVGKGSVNKPCMVSMEWKGSNNPPVALVGKGICFDSGGINLKTSHLLEMKWDKAGAGVIMGLMDVISRLKIPVHVVAVVVLAENMPDGGALKPGDVIASLAGKSIEIVDTDAEGRLALADGITYVQRTYSPTTLIDLGTLTKETFGALGGEYAGLFCTDENLSKQLIQAGEKANEKLWPLPLGPYFAKQIRSTIADLKNSGLDGYGESSAAAEFLRSFVDPHVTWAHLDIAGTSWKQDAIEEGVTAFGVRLLLEYLYLL